MTDIPVAFRPASSPDLPEAKWRGFHPGTTVLPAGSTHAPGGRALSCDIRLDRDVEVALRDGTIIYADVFRPITDDPVPAIMAWSPYGKQGGFITLDTFPNRVGVPRDAVSGLQKWEAPDPAYWCAHGYAVVNPDARGAYESHGDIQVFSPQEGQDAADTVEWIGTQPWCSGKVAMAGNSWLGVAQWLTAAQRPPHLAAIAPWEGFTDLYREMTYLGGIPQPTFIEGIVTHQYGRRKIEDVPAMMNQYPLFNDYWNSKRIDTAVIDIPAYVVASYTNALHTRGTFRAHATLDQEKTWLRVHNTQEWPDFYTHQDDLRRFFDHVLKGLDNGWEQTPRVRMAILDPGHDDVVDLPQTAFPPPAVVERSFYLDAAQFTLSDRADGMEQASVAYVADTGSAVFEADFGDLTIAGPMSLRLWVHADGDDDMDLYVAVQKTGVDGAVLVPDVFRGLSSHGATGQLRVSHRALDATRSTSLAPYYTYDNPRPLQPGEIVAVDIEIWPMAMRWHAGEKLRIVVAGKDFATTAGAAGVKETVTNAGRHVIHTGGRYDSHLRAPVLASD
jgi:predicted acyl esterase